MSESGQQVYRVKCVNNSGNFGQCCIFQQSPNNPYNQLTVAWLANSLSPGSSVGFQWTQDYSFVWSETGVLTPGVIFQPAEALPADRQRSNQVTLTAAAGAASFINQRQGPPDGNLYLIQEPTIPRDRLSIGFGVSGAAAFAQQAQPNVSAVFFPNQQYRIIFGDYIQGQILNPEGLGSSAELSFPAGKYSLSAVLNKDNSWTIKPE